MIAGSDCMEIFHEKDTVVVRIRQKGTTVQAHLTLDKAYDFQTGLDEQIIAARAWRPPSLIEYTGEVFRSE